MGAKTAKSRKFFPLITTPTQDFTQNRENQFISEKGVARCAKNVHLEQKSTPVSESGKAANWSKALYRQIWFKGLRNGRGNWSKFHATDGTTGKGRSWLKISGASPFFLPSCGFCYCPYWYRSRLKQWPFGLEIGKPKILPKARPEFLTTIYNEKSTKIERLRACC